MTSKDNLFISHAAVLSLLSTLEYSGDTEMWEVALWHWERRISGVGVRGGNEDVSPGSA